MKDQLEHDYNLVNSFQKTLLSNLISVFVGILFGSTIIMSYNNLFDPVWLSYFSIFGSIILFYNYTIFMGTYSKKNLIVSLSIVFLGLVLNLIETLYFGWNLYPSSNAELVCDFVTLFIILYGQVWFVLKVEVLKNILKKYN